MRSRLSLKAILGTIFLLGGIAGCGPTYPKCDKDDHCAEKGEVCVEGTCQQCRDDSHCSDGQQCKGGRCEAKPECVGNDDCSGNMLCRSGKCQIECNGPTDCGEGLKCMSNRCVDELSCNATSDCGPGMSCLSGRCSSGTDASRGMGCEYPSVRFGFNEAVLSKSIRGELSQIADCIKRGAGTVVIEGHCDERGTEEYNLALGDRRARAVMKYLVTLGVPKGRVNIISKGEIDPKNPASNEAAWAENRRAEFIER